jgi:hypothetical protein
LAIEQPHPKLFGRRLVSLLARTIRFLRTDSFELLSRASLVLGKTRSAHFEPRIQSGTRVKRGRSRIHVHSRLS